MGGLGGVKEGGNAGDANPEQRVRVRKEYGEEKCVMESVSRTEEGRKMDKDNLSLNTEFPLINKR